MMNDHQLLARFAETGDNAGWVEKFNAVSAEVGANFVRQIRRSPSMGQLEATDPGLAKALGN